MRTFAAQDALRLKAETLELFAAHIQDGFDLQLKGLHSA